MEKEKDQKKKLAEEKKETLPEYEPPKVVTYSGDELLAELGPVQACSPFGVI
ncbi:MAG: hypothetical protein ACE5IH_07525 [Thermodesulfobacteriota bacterium]